MSYTNTVDIFLDTEFTHHLRPELISIGLIGVNGQTFYAELSDGWDLESCSDFVLGTVLPMLGEIPAHHMSHAACGNALAAWLDSLGQSIRVIYDYPTDWDLLLECMEPYAPDWRFNLFPMLLQCDQDELNELARLKDLFYTNTPLRHHALIDAMALRFAFVEAGYLVGLERFT